MTRTTTVVFRVLNIMTRAQIIQIILPIQVTHYYPSGKFQFFTWLLIECLWKSSPIEHILHTSGTTRSWAHLEFRSDLRLVYCDHFRTPNALSLASFLS